MKNKIVVIVIAHNEEKMIGKCLLSLTSQTVFPNKIIVLVHNSTDGTGKIVDGWIRGYTARCSLIIQAVYVNGEPGVPHARLAALKYVEEDEIILCIDGDSVAKKNWIEVMTETLKSNDNVLVGSLARFTGSIICWLLNITHWWHTNAVNEKAIQWLWGGSFAFKAEHQQYIEDALKKSIMLEKKLNLSNSMEDYIRAYEMLRHVGNIQVTRKTCIWMRVKEKNWFGIFARTKANLKNKEKLDNYFANEK